MGRPTDFTPFGAELDQALAAAKTVAAFTQKWSWFMPWFIPEQFQPELHELADTVIDVAGRYPETWAKPKP